jgi:biopolymer transport protein ExbD
VCGGGFVTAHGSKSVDLLTEINVTPLVDVVLVLLILMMVTATTLATQTIALELPRAKTGDAPTPNETPPLVLALAENGALYVDHELVEEAAVRAKIRHDAPPSAILAADGRCRHEAVVHALELLRSENISKIAIVVRADDAP